jgi:signal transduction histidine kinase
MDLLVDGEKKGSISLVSCGLYIENLVGTLKYLKHHVRSAISILFLVKVSLTIIVFLRFLVKGIFN